MTVGWTHKSEVAAESLRLLRRTSLMYAILGKQRLVRLSERMSVPELPHYS